MGEDLFLNQILAYVVDNNINFNGYHNNTHIVNVFEQALWLSHEYDLSDSDKYEVCIAALFHDFNHSGGRLPDNENIELAITALVKFYDNNTDVFDNNGINIKTVIDLIKITEYPYKKEPTTLQEKILIDSDLSEIYMGQWYNSVIVGLHMDELKATKEQALDNQLEFINNVTYYTDIFKSIHNEYKNSIIEKINTVKKSQLI